MPIESESSRGISSGIAVSNPNDIPVQLTLGLRDPAGVLVPNARAGILLQPRGHLAKFTEELLAGKGIDFLRFLGTLEIQSSAPVSITAIRMSPGQFATLPVTPVF